MGDSMLDPKTIMDMVRLYIPKVLDSYHEVNVLTFIQMLLEKAKQRQIKQALEQCDGLTNSIREQQNRA